MPTPFNTALSRRLLLGMLASSAVALPSLGTAAEPIDFSDQTVEFIVPYTEGGGTDVYARLFAPFLEKHLPGNPAIVIRNLPGGGSIMGSNQFEARAKPDGLSLIATSSSTLVAQLFGGEKRQFDVLDWRQIVVSPQGTIVYFLASTGVTGKDVKADIEKLRGQTLRYGAKQPDAGELRNILAFEVLGLKVDTIFGLARGDVRQAMMRGEMQVNHDTAETYFSSVESLVDKGEVVPLFTLGYPQGGQIVRDPLFPDLPTVGEIYKTLNGQDPSGPTWEAFRSFVNLGVAASKGLALPKGTPDEIRDVYIEAVRKTIEDEEFKKLAGNELGQYPQVLGNEADTAIRQAVDLTPEVDAWLKDFLYTRFAYKI